MAITKVLPNPILPQVSPRDINGVILTYAVTTRTLGDIIREHARAINQIIDWTTALDASWVSWSPSISAYAGTYTTIAFANGWYKYLNSKTVVLQLEVKITTNGTAANGMVVNNVPFTLPRIQVGNGREIWNSGNTLNWSINTTNGGDLYTYNNGHPTTDGSHIICSAVVQL